MQRVRFKLSLRLILPLLIVQTLVTWLPNQQAQAAAPTTADLVADARYVLALAAKENETYAPYFEKVLKAFQTVEVKSLPPETDYAHCRKNFLVGKDATSAQRTHPFAYYIPSQRTIYLCQAALKQPQDRIVQTLIHEASHAAGFANECDATRLSILALMITRRVPLQVGYESACAIL